MKKYTLYKLGRYNFERVTVVDGPKSRIEFLFKTLLDGGKGKFHVGHVNESILYCRDTLLKRERATVDHIESLEAIAKGYRANGAKSVKFEYHLVLNVDGELKL
jgi:hypothetical protein